MLMETIQIWVEELMAACGITGDAVASDQTVAVKTGIGVVTCRILDHSVAVDGRQVIEELVTMFEEDHRDLCDRIEQTGKLDDDLKQEIIDISGKFREKYKTA